MCTFSIYSQLFLPEYLLPNSIIPNSTFSGQKPKKFNLLLETNPFITTDSLVSRLGSEIVEVPRGRMGGCENKYLLNGLTSANSAAVTSAHVPEVIWKTEVMD